MAAISPVITPADKLSFTVFLALALHAAIILGVTFTYLDRSPSTHTMEVTLAQHRSNNQPDKADFLAQFNQQGSGTLEKKALTATTTEAEFLDTVIRKTSPMEVVPSSPKVSELTQTVVATTRKSENKASIQANLIEQKTDDSKNPIKKTLLERSLEIASLEARLDKQRQIHAKRPRIKRLTSLSTKSSADAYYLHSWRRKIEKIGNLNYPRQASSKRLFGSLRLMVAIRPDGSLKEVVLLESSGHQVLDDAAMHIVRLASPFAPFPDDLRGSTDELEIIRTWQFRKNSSLRSF